MKSFFLFLMLSSTAFAQAQFGKYKVGDLVVFTERNSPTQHVGFIKSFNIQQTGDYNNSYNEAVILEINHYPRTEMSSEGKLVAFDGLWNVPVPSLSARTDKNGNLDQVELETGFGVHHGRGSRERSSPDRLILFTFANGVTVTTVGDNWDYHQKSRELFRKYGLKAFEKANILLGFFPK